MDRCSPNFADQTVSCFTKSALINIVRAYNKNHMDPIKVGENKTKEEIWEAIRYKMREKCGKDETCWLEQPFLKSHPELAEYFKPLAPLGQYQWLSTDDIYGVLDQYDQKYKDFKFMGALPMDFLTLNDKDSTKLRNLNLSRDPHRVIGIVFNMDTSKEKGSHWVALNINLVKKEIHFFDSYGDKHYQTNKYNLPYYDSYGRYYEQAKIAIPPNIQTLIYRLLSKVPSSNFSGGDNSKRNKSQSKFLQTPFKIKVNTVQHQYANSECGIYSMLFVIQSLTKTFEQITNDIIMDEMANQYRDVLFRRR